MQCILYMVRTDDSLYHQIEFIGTYSSKYHVQWHGNIEVKGIIVANIGNKKHCD